MFGTLSSAAFAGGYDSSWYKAKRWSGEYPDGVSVVKTGINVKGRTSLSKELKPTVNCDLPYRAVFQPWNARRAQISHVSFYTLSKIQTLVAKEDFDFVADYQTGKKLAIQKGQAIEFLMYDQEGFFLVRINGEEYSADTSLFTHIEGYTGETFSIAQDSDEWLRLTCKNGNRAWLLVEELKSVRGIVMDGNIKDYGTSRDLTAREAEDLAKQSP